MAWCYIDRMGNFNNDGQSSYRLFIDLDGVLVDFDSGVLALFGKSPEELPPRVMWPRLAKTSGFYDKLTWMPDGRELWEFTKQYQPIILTGLPIGTWAEPQKRAWCQRELGSDIPVITCMSKEKHYKALEACQDGEKPVLVDDRLKLKERWEDVGGIFIHHISAAESIAALQNLGFD